MRSSDWSSDVCSSDLMRATIPKPLPCSCEGRNPVPTPPAAKPPELDSCLRRNATFLAAAQQTHRRVAFEEVEADPGRLPPRLAQSPIAVDQQMRVVPRRIEQGGEMLDRKSVV